MTSAIRKIALIFVVTIYPAFASAQAGSAKEVLTPEKYDELENGSEEVVIKFRKPAMQLAEKLFK